MEIHYNAFISYRHHPEDIQAAEQIHRSLERYPLPRSLKKTTGGIRRIFRDKEELPITSNLSEDIESALRNSDFLIVICSTHTKESTWVQREIDLFLETHDRNHVLTVLVNGEPYEVIPPCLLKETRHNAVTGQLEEVELEPLSCDWRDKRRKIRSQELARLAAPLLGCSYDGLRQRQKRYQAQIRMAVVSIALTVSTCFLGYFLYSNLQIRKNYNQALKNQSTFLASAAQELLHEGDRLSSMALAIEALPKFEGERPYVSAAEEALTDAAGIYNDVEEIAAITTFKTDALISRARISKDGKTLFALDKNYKLYSFDTDSFDRIGTLQLDFFPNNLFPTQEGNLVLVDAVDHVITCCSPRLEILWTKAFEGQLSYLESTETILLLDCNYQTDENFVRSLADMTLRFLDADSGDPQMEPMAFTADFELNSDPLFKSEQYPTKNSLVFSCWEEGSSDPILGYLDFDSATLKKLPIAYETTCITADGAPGKLLVLTDEETDILHGFIDKALTTGPIPGTLFQVDCSTMTIDWQISVESDFGSNADLIQYFPETQQIFCLKGNLCSVIDSTTGQVVSHSDVPGTPLACHAEQNFAMMVLDNGYYSYFSYERSYCDTIRFYDGILEGSIINGGVFSYTGLQTEITLYRSLENRAAIPCDAHMTYPQQVRHSENALAILTEEQLHLFDLSQKSMRWSVPADSFYCHLLGFDSDQEAVWILNKEHMALIRYDCQNGSSQSFYLPDSYQDQSLYYEESCRLSDGAFLILCRQYQWEDPQRELLLKFDLDGKNQQFIPLWINPSEIDYLAKKEILTAESSHALVYCEDHEEVYQVSFAENSCKTLYSQVERLPYAGLLAEGRDYWLSLGENLELRNWEDSTAFTIETPAPIVSARTHDGELLTLSSNAGLYRYDEKGTLLSSQDLHILTNFFYRLSTDGNQDIHWSFTEDQRLVLQSFDSASVFNLEDWQVASFVPNLLAYSKAQNTLFIYQREKGGFQIYAVPRYSLEQLLTYAKEELGHVTLTDQQREQYGLSSQENP